MVEEMNFATLGEGRSRISDQGNTYRAPEFRRGIELEVREECIQHPWARDPNQTSFCGEEQCEGGEPRTRER